MASVAAVDIGTNSVRMLIWDEQGRELARPMHMTRLGQGVDVTGQLASDAIARTLAVLERYRAQAEGAQHPHQQVAVLGARGHVAGRRAL